MLYKFNIYIVFIGVLQKNSTNTEKGREEGGRNRGREREGEREGERLTDFKELAHIIAEAS